MAQHSKIILTLMVILLLMVTFLATYVITAPTTSLVVNRGFEDGMKGWELGPSPRAGVDFVCAVPKTGSHCLRLIGGGVGLLQKLDHRSIFRSMQLSFYTLLNSTAEEEPWALFHLYFQPNPPNGLTYYVDITVTPDDAEDLAAVFEPNPGIDTGGIYLRFNREPKDSWIHISVDISKLMERYLPDFVDPHINRIMLESAEGGKVYFDDISLNATNLGHLQFIESAWHYIAYSTISKTFVQVLGYSAVGGICVSIYHWWRSGKRFSFR